MNLLDMRTIVFSYVVTNIICVWFVLLLWRQSRDRFAGIAFLVIDFIFQTAALILIVLRGAVPDWISMILSNTLVVTGAILGFMGLERFVGKRGPQIHNYLLVILFIFVHGYFVFVQPSLAVRNLNIAAALLLVCVQSVWLLWHRVESGLRSLTFGVGLVFFLFCLVNVVRILQFFTGVHGENNYFQSGISEALVLVSYQVLFLLLTYSLVLMVNKRLLMQIGTQEEKFAKVFHSAPYALTLTRPSDGKIVEVNETFFSITGYDRTEVMGKNTVDLGLWEHDTDRAAAVDALLKTGKVQGNEFNFRKKNGETMTGLFSAEIIAIDGEKSILSSIGDITELKRAEDVVKREQVLSNTIIDSIPGPFYMLNEHGHYVRWNTYQREVIIGKPEEHIAGMNALETIHPEDRALIQARIANVLQDGKEEAVEGRVLLRGGPAFIWMLMTGRRMTIDDHPLLIGTGVDITERKRAEEALRESQALLNEMGKMAKVGGWELDTDTLELRWTEETYRIHELSPESKPPLEEAINYFHPEEREKLSDSIQHALKYGEAYDMELRFITAKGKHLWTRTICIPQLVDGKTVRLKGSFQDITERKQAEEALKKSKEQYRQAQKMESIGQLAGGVAHDFNNMLNIILGYSQLALMKIEPSGPLHTDIQEIMNAARRSADLVRQLLAFARKQIIAPKVLDLNDTVAGILNMLRKLIGEDIDLLWMPAANLWPVKMDPTQVDQLLANLAANARDSISGVGKITIETGRAEFDEAYCSQHAGFIPGQFAMLAVSDDGCGMDKETCDQIFEPFFTTKEFGKGTGMGLATVYGIVKQNNGFINVYSEPGKGTTFKIYLPRYGGEAEEVIDEPREQVKPLTGTEVVLLVEDEETLLKMSKMMLEELGYTVLAAGNPNEAIKLAGQYAGDIHLLVTDVVMPEMSGRDLQKRLSALRPDMKYLFMSGYTANVIAHRGILDEGVNFLQKPFHMERLATKVREALN